MHCLIYILIESMSKSAENFNVSALVEVSDILGKNNIKLN